MRKVIAFLLFGGLGLVGFGQSNPCSAIDSTFDKFEGKRTFYSPTEEVQFFKVINKDKSQYYVLNLMAKSHSSSRGNKVTILFDDNSRVEFSGATMKIDIKAIPNGYAHMAMILLKPSDVELFVSKKITDFQIGTQQMLDLDGEPYKQRLKCLTKIK